MVRIGMILACGAATLVAVAPFGLGADADDSALYQTGDAGRTWRRVSLLR